MIIRGVRFPLSTIGPASYNRTNEANDELGSQMFQVERIFFIDRRKILTNIIKVIFFFKRERKSESGRSSSAKDSQTKRTQLARQTLLREFSVGNGRRQI